MKHCLKRKKKRCLGQQDGLVHKEVCCQAWWPGFDSQQHTAEERSDACKVSPGLYFKCWPPNKCNFLKKSSLTLSKNSSKLHGGRHLLQKRRWQKELPRQVQLWSTCPIQRSPEPASRNEKHMHGTNIASCYRRAQPVRWSCLIAQSYFWIDQQITPTPSHDYESSPLGVCVLGLGLPFYPLITKTEKNVLMTPHCPGTLGRPGIFCWTAFRDRALSPLLLAFRVWGGGVTFTFRFALVEKEWVMALITFLPISHLERTKCNIQERVGITIFFRMIVQM